MKRQAKCQLNAITLGLTYKEDIYLDGAYDVETDLIVQSVAYCLRH